MNYHDKKFKVINNSSEGEVGEDLIFHYQQRNNHIWCDYSGYKIIKGHLLGKVKENGSLEFSYHQINVMNELRTGICTSVPEILPNGKIRLHESWQWTSGNKLEGSSLLEEI
jgi:hypothetical protein